MRDHCHDRRRDFGTDLMPAARGGRSKGNQDRVVFIKRTRRARHRRRHAARSRPKAEAIDLDLRRPDDPAPEEERQRGPCAVAAAYNDLKIRDSIVTACNSRDAAFGR